MGDQEEYERGVRDGQKAGVMDQFCNSLSRPFGNPAYDKGFDYGVDHKPSDSGSSSWWGNSSESKNSGGSSSWWAGSSESKNSESSNNEGQGRDSDSVTSQATSSDGGSYSYGSGGSYSGGSYGSSTSTESRSLVTRIGGFLILGAVCWSSWHFFGGSKSDTYQTKSQISRKDDSVITIEDYKKMSPEEKSRGARKYSQELKQGLEGHVKVLEEYLKQSGKIKGNLDDYQFIMPPTSIVHGSSDYQVAVISSTSFEIFKSPDLGNTWSHNPGIFSNSFFRQLEREYVQQVKRYGKVGQGWLTTLKSRSNNHYYLPSNK